MEFDSISTNSLEDIGTCCLPCFGRHFISNKNDIFLRNYNPNNFVFVTCAVSSTSYLAVSELNYFFPSIHSVSFNCYY